MLGFHGYTRMARVYLDQATVSSVVYTVYAGGQSYTPSFLSEIGLKKVISLCLLRLCILRVL